MGQEKSMRGGDEDPILRPRFAPLPSLIVTVVLVGFGFGLFLKLCQRFLAGDSDKWFC